MVVVMVISMLMAIEMMVSNRNQFTEHEFRGAKFTKQRESVFRELFEG